MESTKTETTGWVQRPIVAAFLRLVIFVLPLIAAVAFISVANRVVPRPSGWAPTVLWFAVLTAGVMTVVYLGDRLLRGLLPIVALFRLSLVFPDRAPSRFKMALRQNTVRRLQRSVADGTLHDGTPQEAAEHLLLLAGALNDHDRLTRGHTERVRAYSLMIGEEMGLPEEDLAKLHWAGLIHDVGKLEVPAEILSKDGRPTVEEWAILKSHPAMGDHLVEPLREWLGEWADAAAQHHERWDGGGYPSGLAAENISLSGRIVAVADAYDVITSARSYKPPHSAEFGRKELADNAGTQFDPTVVRAFLNIGLGRLRVVMGPMSWLTQLPFIGQSPLAPALGTVATSAVAVVTAGVAGFVAPATEELPLEPALGVEFIADAPEFAPIDIVMATVEDASTSIDLADFYDSPDSIRLVSQPTDGVLTLGADQTLHFEPAPDADEDVVAQLEVCLGDVCKTTTVTIGVEAVNDAPIVADDVGSTAEDTPTEIAVLDNDTDVDGDTLTITSISRTGGFIGDAAVIVGNHIRYTPAPDAHGVVLLEYTVDDGSGTEVAGTITIEVLSVNDAPIARDDGATTDYETPITLAPLDNDTDVDGDPLTVFVVSDLVGGSAGHDGTFITFTPSPGHEGPASLRYTIVDSFAASEAAITVFVGSNPMAAFDDTAVVLEDESVLIDVTANDLAPPTGFASTSLGLGGAPSDGIASLEGGKVRYTPSDDFVGVDRFEYDLCDVHGRCRRAEVSVTVTPVNDAPSFAVGPDVTVVEDSGAAVLAPWVTAISAGPADENGQSVSFAVSNDNGALFAVAPTISPTGTLTFTPADDTSGTATITITLADDAGAVTSAISATITVSAVNDPPTFQAGANVTVAEDSGPAIITPWATAISAGPADESAQTVSFAVSNDNAALFAAAPAMNPAGTLTFIPADDANGTATITITASDSGGASGPATAATITIGPVNDPPSAVDDSATIAEDTSLASINVLTNDTDLDLDTLSVSAFDGSTIVDGVLTSLGGGAFSYVPDPDFFGTETFTYTVTDGNGGFDGGTVSLEVTPTPDAPVALDDSFTGPEDTDVVVSAPGILTNDLDLDGDALTVDTTPVTPPAAGTLTLGADGSFTYSPNPGFVGNDRFVYRVTDPGALAATATVVLTINDGVVETAYFFDDSGASASDYDLVVAPPPSSAPVFDTDSDTKPGLTFKKTADGLSETDPDRYQYWTLPAPGSTVSLDGPVTLDLWSTLEDFANDKKGHVQAWLHDCLGVSCTLLTSTGLHSDDWNGTVNDWVYREIDLGSVTHDVLPGHELRLRIQFRHEKMWVAMTADYPSGIRLTIANTAPVAVDDAPAAILEDAATTSLDPTANDIDTNIDKTSITITSPATLGTALPQLDGTIDYTPTADLNGVESFDYEVCDTGGLCDIATVSFTITPVNDAPSFVGGGDINTTVGAQTFVAWFTSISAGPADESGQVLTWSGNYTNSGIFVTPPSVDAGGTLTFETSAPGVSTFTIRLSDDGGGTDTSADYVYTVTIS